MPGLGNSGPGHWQTLWEAELDHVVRVQQSNWDAPQRDDWLATLNQTLLAIDGPVIVVAHSLGCALIAWCVAQQEHTLHTGNIVAALLVAPADVEQADFPAAAVGFSPMPRRHLPFRAIVVASTDDSWCALPQAQSFAADWGAEFYSVGARGHLNAQSNLGSWPRGRAFLTSLT